MESVRLPAGLIASGAVPPVCARHGLPPAAHTKVAFISRVPGWSYVLLLIGVVVFLIVVLVTRKTVTAPGWSFCAQCRTRRRNNLFLGLGVIVGCLVLFFAAIALVPQPTESDPNPSGMLTAALFVLALVALIAGIVLLSRAAPPHIAGGITSRDGLWVQFAKVAPGFAQWARSVTPPEPAYGQPFQGQPQPYYPQPEYGQPPGYGQQPYRQQPYGQ